MTYLIVWGSLMLIVIVAIVIWGIVSLRRAKKDSERYGSGSYRGGYSSSSTDSAVSTSFWAGIYSSGSSNNSYSGGGDFSGGGDSGSY